MSVRVIVGCGQAKRHQPARARDLYLGTYHRAAVDWALSVRAELYILSARYGLVPGDQVLVPYDATLGQLDTGQLARQARELGLAGPVITLAGTAYRRVLDRATPIEPVPLFRDLAWSLGLTENGRGGWGDQIHLMRAYAGRVPQLEAVPA